MTAQTCLILGATGGIGSALCRRLARRGANLVISARDEVRLSSLAAELGAIALPGDASSLAHVEACIKLAQDRFGPVHAVANCIGSLLLKPAHSTSPEEFQATITTNLTTAFNTIRAGAQAMSSHGSGGSIVLCSSAVARHGFANHEAISAAKAGIIGLALSAAATYAPRNIRINVVAPGLTRTPLTERLFASEPGIKASTAMHALGRTIEPDEVAAAIDFLLNPENRSITGQVLAIDAGLGSLRPR